MKIHPQTIYNGDQPEYVILPINEYNMIISSLEDFQDIQEVHRSLATPGETFPLELVKSLSEGKSAIKVYREYRGISQTDLAKKINVSKQYISQLECGNRVGTARILKAIAKALRVDFDDLTRSD